MEPRLASNGRMRRALIAVLVALLAVVVLGIVAVSLLNVDHFRPKLQAELQDKIHRPVTLGQLHLKLFPLSIKADGLTIGQSAAFASQYPLATAKQIYASASLGSLFSGKPDIKALTLQDPQIELIRNASGAWNFSDLAGGNNTSGSSSSSQFTLDKLQVNNGQVAITDQHAGTRRAVYNVRRLP